MGETVSDKRGNRRNNSIALVILLFEGIVPLKLCASIQGRSVILDSELNGSKDRFGIQGGARSLIFI